MDEVRKRGGEACLEVRGSRDGSQDNQSCGSVVADEYGIGKGLVDSRRNCKEYSDGELEQTDGAEQTPEEASGVQDAPEQDSSDGSEDVDFSLFGDKKLSLLERCRDKEMTEQKLRRAILKSVEEVDKVDKDYGALHYLVTKRHRNKPTLLELLVIQGGANVDLTTTKYHYTALHLAVKHNDFESVEVLISLDANVNVEDFLGNTPLDMAVFQSRLKKFSSGDIKLSLLKPHEEFEESVSSAEAVSALTKEENAALDRIKELLLSVGAQPGSSSRKLSHRSTETCRKLKKSYTMETGFNSYTTETVLKDLKTVPKSHTMETVPKGYGVETEAFNFSKINTVYYREVHDKFQEWIRCSNVSHPPKAGEAGALMRKMREMEEYRRKCGSRILFLDGGGVRGLVQMAVLREIERRMGKKIVELFDWIVGTSTGGIIALALTYGPLDPNSGIRQAKTVHQLRNIYWTMKDDIFGASQDGFLGFLARGNTQKLEEILQLWLGKDTSLQDVTYPKVLIPAVSKKHSNLDMHFFNNSFNDEHSRELVWKVARYTSAAPFYFKEFEGYIDGGMMANNPSEVGLTEIQKFYHERGEKLPISLVVSIGSGKNPGTPLGEIDIKSNFLDPRRYCDLLSVLAAAVVNWPAHSSCEVRCREEGISYYRFNPELPEKVSSEQHDSKVLQRMILTTRKYIHSKKDRIDDLVTKLKESNLTSTLTVTD